MPRVLMVVSNGFTHDPRVSAEAASLARAGFRVTVLAWDRRGALPAQETRDGVDVRRVRSTVWMRLRGYDLFRLKAFWRLATDAALALHREGRFDAIHCHDLDTLPIGARFKEATGARLVYDAHEIFPYMVELSRARAWADRFAALDRQLAGKADAILVAGPAYVDYFRGLADAAVAIVMHARPPADAYEPPRNPRMVVSYVGGLEPSRLLLPLAELAREDPSFEVQIAGDGPLAGAIRSHAAASRGNLRYLGVVPMDRVLPLTKASDVVFSVFDPAGRLNRLAPPNKFYEAIAVGRPLLVSRGTWVGDEVVRAECGLAIEYTKDALRRALASLAADPSLRERLGRNALRLAKERYNWAVGEAALLRAYRGIGLAPT